MSQPNPNINLNDTTPSAPAGAVNAKWQADSNNPRNVSAYIPAATSSSPGVVPTPPNDATKFLDGTAQFDTIKDTDLSTSDVSTNNVSSAKHGFAPKAPADATKFLNGAATPDYAQVKDSDLAISDVTTNNVSITKHGFVPKAPNDATKYLDGTGAWSVPAGGGGGSSTFLGLTDTPFSYVGQANKVVSVKADETGLEFTTGGGGGGGGLPAWLTFHPDAPPSSPNAMDDEFDGTSLDPKWTWRNQGTATVTFSKGALIITDSPNVGHCRILEQSLPSPPYEFTLKVGLSAQPLNYAIAGFSLFESASSKLITYHINANSSTKFSINVTRFNSVSSYNSDIYVGPTLGDRPTLVYMRVSYDGSNINYLISPDGVSFYKLASSTGSGNGFLISAPDKIGIVINNTNNQQTQNIMGDFHWFRRTA